MLGFMNDTPGVPAMAMDRPLTGFLRRTVYNTAGTFTWNRGYGTTAIRVFAVAQGDPGNGTTTDGGTPGFAESVIDVSSIVQVPVVVTITAGQTASFGSYISVTNPAVNTGFAATITGGDFKVPGKSGLVVTALTSSGSSTATTQFIVDEYA